MCYVEDVFHRPCRHWGLQKFTEACVRSRTANGRATGCGYHTNIGMANSDELCQSCKYRAASGGWRPFANMGDQGWSRVRRCLRERRLQGDS